MMARLCILVAMILVSLPAARKDLSAAHGSIGKRGPTAHGVLVNPRSLSARGRPTAERQLRSSYVSGAPGTPSFSFPALNFCGHPNCGNPPDGGFAVGPASMLVALNHEWALYDRSGNLQLGPIVFNTFFHSSIGAYDPHAIYDAGNTAAGGYGGGHGRFVMVAVATDHTHLLSTYYLTVSETENPQSASSGWCIFSFSGLTGSGSSLAYADYPVVGMDGNNLYITSEELAFTSTTGTYFREHRLIVIPKASVYPNAATGVCPAMTSTLFEPLTNPDGTLARDVEPANNPDALPGQTLPMYFVNAIDGKGAKIALRTVQASPGVQLTPPVWVSVSPYDRPLSPPQPAGNAIQPSGPDLLGALYRYGAIYAANTTLHVSSSLSTTPNPFANVQWYKIDPLSLSAQSHAIADPNVAYYTPDVMAGCSTQTTPGANGAPVCSMPFVSLEVTGSGPSQPVSAYSVLDSNPPVLYGAGVPGYTTGTSLTSWGDFPGVSADPVSPLSTWLLGEYAQTSTNWGTQVAQLTAPSTPPFTPTPTSTLTPTSTATPTPGPSPRLSAAHAGTITTPGGSDSYSFVPATGGTASVVSCGIVTSNTFAVALYDSLQNLLASSNNATYCNWVSAAVKAGQTYTVTTTAMTNGGAYRSAWSVNGARVTWNVSGTIATPGGSSTFSFPTLSTAQISLSTCGPSGANYDLYILSANNLTLASATASSNCQSLVYTPGSRDLYRLQEVSASGTGSWSGSVTTG